jgi:hypothetical protein
MKRRIVGLVAAAAAVGAVVGLVPLSSAHAAVLVKACVTVTPKHIGLTVNGIPVGVPGPGVGLPTTCVGV